jgi:hypothetical protein
MKTIPQELQEFDPDISYLPTAWRTVLRMKPRAEGILCALSTARIIGRKSASCTARRVTDVCLLPKLPASDATNI